MTADMLQGITVLDFTIAGRPGLLELVARLSLTQVIRSFEQGLLSLSLVTGVPPWIWKIFFVVVFTFLNVRGIKTSARVNTLLAAGMGASEG